jgi:hypothetical protein
VGAGHRHALAKGAGGYTHLLVAIDKFSKWVEVRPITNLRAEQAVTFFTDIVYHFGVPNSIITDNGSQFTGRKSLEFCDKFNIRVDWAAVAHPQTNSQVERANGMILQGLKPMIFDRLNKSGRKWLQELPAVVWSLRTTPSRAIGFTPFFLVHGAEAVLPTDLEYGSPRVRGYDEGANQRAREDSLDQLDEARTVALMHSARYQRSLRLYQARKVRRRDYSEEDLVLRRRQDNRGRHKLSPPWEGPYVVVVQAGQRGWRRTHQRLEHPVATSLLPLARISKLFVVNYMPDTPVGSTNVNNRQLIKLKGNSAFP